MQPVMVSRRAFVSAAAVPAVSWAAPASAPAGKLRAGAATSNITPPLGSSLAGSMTDHIGTQVHDELHVRALALDNGSTRLAFAVCDLCVIPREQIDRAKELIQTHTGIPPSHVLVSAVHTHSAPPAAHLFQSKADPHYLEFLVVRIAAAVRLAVGRLEPARIGWGLGRQDQLVFNRRYFMRPGTVPPDPFGRTTDTVLMNPGIRNPNVVKPAGPVDPDVGVLAVEALDGRPISVLGNYALHYVGDVGGGDISADYFASWADAMERLAGEAGSRRYPPFVPLLTNACSGNINNVDVLHGSAGHTPPYTHIRQVADALAAECHRVWRGLRFSDTVPLAASVEELELALRMPSPEDLAAARRTLSSAPATGQLRDRAQIYARETVILAETYPNMVRTPLQALRIGDLAIGTWPGEAFVELGLEVKAKSPFRPTMLIELANDYRGYIPTVEGFQQGGYETWRAKSSCLETQAAPRMTASLLRQLHSLAQS